MFHFIIKTLWYTLYKFSSHKFFAHECETKQWKAAPSAYPLWGGESMLRLKDLHNSLKNATSQDCWGNFQKLPQNYHTPRTIYKCFYLHIY